MLVLVWLSVFLLAAFLITFLVWSAREERVSMAAVRRGFWGGVIVFGLLFVVFTAHTLTAIPRATHDDQLTLSVVNGKLAWQKYICVDCHTILGNGAYYAPDLTKAWNRFLDRSGGDEAMAEGALIAFLKNPPAPTDTRRGMPAYAMSDVDASSIADYLKWTSKIDTNGWPPQPRRGPIAVSAARGDTKGEKFFQASCSGCHSIGGGRILGPDLAGVGNRMDRETLVQFIRDPRVVYAHGGAPRNPGYPLMPPLGIKADDARAVADYLIGRSGS